MRRAGSENERTISVLNRSKRCQEFCARHKVDLDKVDFSQKKGQHLRRQLLVLLKDYGGLTYHEIAKLPEFSGVKMNSLGALVRYEKIKKI
jgi:hypothetical protein